MCNKNTYESKSEALADAEFMRKSTRSRFNTMKGGKLKTYLCIYCNRWHLTSRSRSQDKKTKQSIRNRK